MTWIKAGEPILSQADKTLSPPVSAMALATTLAAVGALYSGVVRAEDAKLVQTNLVSDLSSLNATITDSNLKNPWGVSHSLTSPFWVSNQKTNTATLYAVTDQTDVSKVPLTVAIPTTKTGPQGPTGQVNNANADCFPVSVGSGGDGGSAHFIFANLAFLLIGVVRNRAARTIYLSNSQGLRVQMPKFIPRETFATRTTSISTPRA